HAGRRGPEHRDRARVQVRLASPSRPSPGGEGAAPRYNPGVLRASRILRSSSAAAAFIPRPMALIVHKYGGTSMGSTERIRNVAKRVAKWARAGHQLVVVPSAMSGETNRLLGLAKELFPGVNTPASDRELDMIASTGEQVSVDRKSVV